MKSDAFADIKLALTAEQLDEVESRLNKGKPAKAVQELIQNDFGKLTDKQPNALVRQLNRYRQYGLANKVAEKLVESGLAPRIDRLMDEIDVAEDLNQVTEMFRLRIYKYAMMQAEMPMPIEALRAELMEFSKHLERCVKLYMQLGLMDSAPKTIEGVIQNVGTGDTIKFAVTENFQEKLKQIGEMYLNKTIGPNVVEGEVTDVGDG